MSSNLQTDGPLTARKARAEDTLTRRSHAGDPPAYSKGGSEKLLSVGREKKECGSVPSMWPWAMAQLLGCMTQVLLPELASSCLGGLLGMGALLQGPSLRGRRDNPLHPRWHAGSRSLWGTKELSCKTSYFSVIRMKISSDGRPAIGEKPVWGKWLVSHMGVLAMGTMMGQPRAGPCRHNKAG